MQEVQFLLPAILGQLGEQLRHILVGDLAGAVVAGYISSSLRDLFAYMMLVIILIVRPVGIMGRSSEDKA